MFPLKPSADFLTRLSVSRLIAISAFASACVAMFVIPWFFPRAQPVLGESYALGFNNRLAVVGLCVVIVAAAMARWFSPSAAEDARETLAWFARDGWQAIRTASKLEYAILGLFCFFMTQFILWWDSMLVIPYWGEADYFHNRIDLIALGYRPYVDFHHNYGPLMLYGPYWLDQASGGILGSESAYAWILIAWTLLGAVCIFYFVEMLQLPLRSRPWILAMALFMWMPLTMGLNYTPLRFTVVPFAIASLHLVLLHFQEPRLRPVRTIAMSAVAASTTFVISPEMGVACSAGILSYAAILALRGDWLCSVTCILGAGLACGIIHYSFHGYFHGMQAFAAGANNFPIYPNLHNLLLAGAATVVISRLVAAAVVSPKDDRAPFAAAIAAASLIMLSPSLGRCDPGHVILNSLVVFLLLFPASASKSMRLHVAWSVIFGIAMLLLNQVSYWSHYSGQYSYAFAAARFYRDNPAAVLEWTQAWDSRRNRTKHGERLNWKRTVPFPKWANEVTSLQGSVGVPVAADVCLDRLVKLQEGYRPPYHPCPKPEILTNADVTRAVADARKNEVVFLPENLVAASQADTVIDQQSYEQQVNNFLSWLMIFPVRCTMRYQPFLPEIEVVRRLMVKAELVGNDAGCVLVRPSRSEGAIDSMNSQAVPGQPPTP
jgi:hypothetical protein